ncbi:FtsW/RodA/SpoVE family cell cycle protein [Maribacter sp. 2307ULW6-5]|uniref:FtsW/RodA/SpoVE family cell cycle protein n=1 Tax=Maribacter sp. 2307ULW6-5 TaxID=3386275 RepID=UPI0039BD3F6E
MQAFFKNIRGDKAIWAIAALLAIFSFLPVYSASSNLVYVVGNGTTVGHLMKHALLLFLGFGIMYGMHNVPTHYFNGLSKIALPVVMLLLIFVLAQGGSEGGTNASRWIRIPFVGFGFQPSNLASVVLLAYVAGYLSHIRDKTVTFAKSFLPLWVPVFMVVFLILPANFSTAAILFTMVMMICFLGGYPFKYLLAIVGAGILFLTMFVVTAKAFPDLFPNRVDTWMSRIDSFNNPDDKEANYQIEKAKIAIATGGVFGKGAGKSVQKNLLPQSSSDFIYAIIVEEYGLVGGVAVMFFYMLFLFRVVVVANGCHTVFSKLLVLGVGLPIVFQALVNMAVAVEMFPVTGQNLPLLSSGGTSSWMTCLAIGIILSASNKRNQKQMDESPTEGDSNNPLAVLSGQL